MKNKMWKYIVIILFAYMLWGSCQSIWAEELLDEIDFTELQILTDGMLEQHSFSLSETVKKIMSGEKALSWETIQEYLYGLFFKPLSEEREFFFKVLMCVLMAAIFSVFSNVFGNNQIGDMSFYIAYLMLFILIVNTFLFLTQSLAAQLQWMSVFMKGVAPVFFLAVAVADGMTTAAIVQEGILLLAWFLQWVMLQVLLPLTSFYIIIKLVNCLSKEEMLGKLADLLNSLICWGTRTVLGTMVGFQLIRNITAPVIDEIKRGVFGKTASALPGIGNAVNSVTELLLTSAVLVKNSMGTMFMIILFLVGMMPGVQYVIYCIGMRFVAALAEPVSDKRIIDCVAAMGDGCGILLKILFTAQILCVLDILILLVNFGGGK